MVLGAQTASEIPGSGPKNNNAFDLTQRVETDKIIDCMAQF